MGLTRAQLTAIAVATGYPVKAAWVTGHGVMGDIAGTMLHHTATPDSAPGDYPSLKIVTQGRSDLPGPLCNFGLGRSGTIYLVSDGIAWHAGPGLWKGLTAGNTHLLGIEAENGGTGKPWPADQLDAYTRLVASIHHTIGRGVDWYMRHAAWALPPGRKVDTQGIDMNWFDARVAAMLKNPSTISRNGSQGDDMSDADVAKINAHIDALMVRIFGVDDKNQIRSAAGVPWAATYGKDADGTPRTTGEMLNEASKADDALAVLQRVEEKLDQLLTKIGTGAGGAMSIDDVRAAMYDVINHTKFTTTT